MNPLLDILVSKVYLGSAVLNPKHKSNRA